MDQYNGYGYYGGNDPQYYNNQNPQKRRGAGGYIATAVLSFIAGCLVMSMLIANSALYGNGKNNQGGTNGSGGNSPFVTATPTPVVTPDPAVPELTPVPTDRLLPSFDGVTPNINDSANPIPDIYDQVKTGVVGVINYMYSSEAKTDLAAGSGTGFVISTEGYIATNAHIIDGATRIVVILHDGSEVDAELVGVDKIYDVAVLKIVANNLMPLKIGDSTTTRVGEFVIAIGDPTGRELASTPTFGIISATEREVNIDGQSNSYVQIDAAVNPGNSGGPLLNMKGEVIGIVSAKTVTASYDDYGNAISAEGLGFALPINGAMEVIETLITSGHMQRPGLGISVSAVDEIYAGMYNIPQGMFVSLVIVDSAADKAGLKPGDIIVKSDGKAVLDQTAFVKSVQSKKVGEQVVFEVWRDGKTFEATVTLGDRNTYGSALVDDLEITDFESYFGDGD